MRPTLVDTMAVQLTRELRVRGPCLSSTLRAAAGLNPATFARVIARLRPRLVAVGATRSLTYALRRTIPGLPDRVPVYEVGPEVSRRFGTLHPIEPGGFHFESDSPLAGFYPELPWFMHDLRPSGFLGRLAPRQHPELRLPPDIQLWTADHVLRWLHDWGVDTAGSLVVGDPAYARLHAHAAAMTVAEQDRGRAYPRRAEEALTFGFPGSSAAGEQPKFLAVRVSGGVATPVLVKFSPRGGDAAARRTADLLRCEHHALRTLGACGIPAAQTTVIEADGRVFLEVERFDRTDSGRLGLVSLLAVAAHEGCDLDGWTLAADGLARGGVIGPEDQRRIYTLDRFGALIANNDRHAGNLSFRFVDGRLAGVAPAYDMLPMQYAVRSGEFTTGALVVPTPTPQLPDAWREAWDAAIAFWSAVAEDSAIDPVLRRVAGENGGRLADGRRWLDRAGG